MARKKKPVMIAGFAPRYRTHKIRPTALKGIRLFTGYRKTTVDRKKVIDKFVGRKHYVDRYTGRRWVKKRVPYKITKRYTPTEVIITAKTNGLTRRLRFKRKEEFKNLKKKRKRKRRK